MEPADYQQSKAQFAMGNNQKKKLAAHKHNMALAEAQAYAEDERRFPKPKQRMRVGLASLVMATTGPGMNPYPFSKK